MKKKEKNQITALGLLGIALLMGIMYALFNGMILVAMILVSCFVMDCLFMVMIATHVDDQTEKINFLNDKVNAQNRSIMSMEGQIAKYKRMLAEVNRKNETRDEEIKADSVDDVLLEEI